MSSFSAQWKVARLAWFSRIPGLPGWLWNVGVLERAALAVHCFPLRGVTGAVPLQGTGQLLSLPFHFVPGSCKTFNEAFLTAWAGRW